MRTRRRARAAGIGVNAGATTNGARAGGVLNAALLAVLRDAGRWREALDAVGELADAAEGLGEDAAAAAPTGAEWAAAISACARAGRAGQALEALGRARAAGAADARAYTAAVAACARGGRSADALGLLTEMEAATAAGATAMAPGPVAVRCAAIACVRECERSPGAAAAALTLASRCARGDFKPACGADELSWLLLVRACDAPGDREGSLRRLACLLAARAGAEPPEALEAGACGCEELPPFDPAAGVGADHGGGGGGEVGQDGTGSGGTACDNGGECGGGGGEERGVGVGSSDDADGRGWYVPVLRQPGWQRRPRNRHDLVVYATPKRGAAPVVLAEGGARATSVVAARHDWPEVDGAMLLSGVLAPAECDALLAAAKAMGFTPDEPELPTVEGDGGEAAAGQRWAVDAAEGASADARGQAPAAAAAGAGIDACVWCADDAVQERLWERVAPLLPRVSPDGGQLHSLNRRWRIYRYTQGAVYRPHVDGDWPPSGVERRGGGNGAEASNGRADGRAAAGARSGTGAGPSGAGNVSREWEYKFDSSGGKARSRLTFLIYLNSGGGVDFDGGHTTFYSAAAAAPHAMRATRATPRKGCVLVFPQGHSGYRAGGAPVHEGSAVTRGTKFVAR